MKQSIKQKSSVLFSLFMIFLVSAQPTFAQPAPIEATDISSPARDLKSVMKDLGFATRGLVTALRANPVNKELGLTSAQQIKSLSLESRSLAPQSVVEANDNGLSQIKFEQLLLQIALEALNVSEALTKGDSAAALSSLAKINELRTEGHDLFKQ